MRIAIQAAGTTRYANARYASSRAATATIRRFHTLDFDRIPSVIAFRGELSLLQLASLARSSHDDRFLSLRQFYRASDEAGGPCRAARRHGHFG